MAQVYTTPDLFAASREQQYHDQRQQDRQLEARWQSYEERKTAWLNAWIAYEATKLATANAKWKDYEQLRRELDRRWKEQEQAAIRQGKSPIDPSANELSSYSRQWWKPDLSPLSKSSRASPLPQTTRTASSPPQKVSPPPPSRAQTLPAQSRTRPSPPSTPLPPSPPTRSKSTPPARPLHRSTSLPKSSSSRKPASSPPPVPPLPSPPTSSRSADEGFYRRHDHVRDRKAQQPPPTSSSRAHSPPTSPSPPPSKEKMEADLKAWRIQLEQREAAAKREQERSSRARDEARRLAEQQERLEAQRKREETQRREDEERGRQEQWRREDQQRRADEQRKREDARSQQTRAEEWARQKGGILSTRDAWIEYESRWQSLYDRPSTSMLTFATIPWPMNPQPRNAASIDMAHVRAFILSKDHSPDKKMKQRLRDQMMRFHPDRFESRLLGRVRESDRAAVKEGVGKIARFLNDAMATV